MNTAYQIPEWAAGKSLIQFLSASLIKESKARLRRLIADGMIKINGYCVNTNATLAKSDVVSMPVELRMEGPDKVQLDRIPGILLEDDDHIAINKPAGLAVSPLHGQEGPQLYDWLLMHLNRHSCAEGPFVRPHIVHRLDRETSGVLLVAKHSSGARHLSMQFQKRTVKKNYVGIVEGVFPVDSFRAVIPLKKISAGAIAMAPDKGGKEAVTEINVIKRFRNFTLLNINPLTGRQHQIRVHLKALGYPLAVDFLYGGRETLSCRELADITGNEDHKGLNPEYPVLERTPLHANGLTYRLPGNGEEITLEAPLPSDMLIILDLLDRRKDSVKHARITPEVGVKPIPGHFP